MNQNPAPHYSQPQPPPPKSSGGSTVLIVLAIVIPAIVVIVGILATLAIYGTRKYIANAKTAEARNALGQIARDAVVAFERDGKICRSASAPVPMKVPSAAKYQSAAADWEVDKAANAGFACLGFEMASPQYYQYEYRATATSFTAYARGDLDGDGTNSEFKLEGRLVGGVLTVAPNLMETNPAE